MPHIVLLEPYFGGSHRAFLEGLQKHLPFRFTLISLPARKWKMRMQLAAPWMADQVISLIRKGELFNGILCSTFIDVATLRSLLDKAGLRIPAAVYFHENQFAYPNQLQDSSIFQFTALNFTTSLAADALAFNSRYNRDTFFAGVAGYLDKATDMSISYKMDELQEKSVVLNPGIDFSEFDVARHEANSDVPIIIWNHRWEHDKDPESFFRALMELSKRDIDFKLIVLGQHFERCPEIFETSRKKLASHILHFGYASERMKYIRLLQQGNLVVSTAVHEFFGMAVLEAVRCGCRPLVPDRLAYREIFPAEYRYKGDGFLQALSAIIDCQHRLDKATVNKLTDQYSWESLAHKYQGWFRSWIH